MGRPRKEEEETKSSLQPPNLTPDEAAIYQRVAGDSNKSWQTITERDIEDFSLSKDPFELPSPAAKMKEEKKFNFKWAEMKPERIDKLKNNEVPFKFWICNSTNTPFLKDYLDPIFGCVIRHGQILMFQPWWMHEKRLEYKRRLAEHQEQGGNIDKKDGKSIGDLEFKSGPDFKIGKGDEVIGDIELLDQELGEKDDSTQLDDIEI